MSSVVLGPLAILIVWAASCSVYFSSDRTGHTTLSAVAASNRRNYAIFTLGLLTSGILIFLFVRFWFINVLNLPPIFLYITGLATLIFQPIVALVPLRGKIVAKIHGIAAYGESILLPVLAAFIVTSPALPVVVRFVCLGLLSYMIYLALEFKKQLLTPRYILIQVAFVGCFHLTILIATLTKVITG